VICLIASIEAKVPSTVQIAISRSCEVARALTGLYLRKAPALAMRPAQLKALFRSSVQQPRQAKTCASLFFSHR
jgi:hypothetical protein